MKTGESNLEQVNNRSQVIITILPLLAMLAAILPCILKNDQGVDVVKIGVLALLLTCVTVFYIKNNANQILNKKFAKTIITIIYLGAILLLLLVPQPEVLAFWMIGGLAVAMLVDYKLGLLMHFNLSFLLGLTITMRIESMIHALIIGSIMCLLSSSLKQKSTVIYTMIIILSTNITLAFIINNFVFDHITGYNYLKSLISVFLVLIAGYFLTVMIQKYQDIKPDEIVFKIVLNQNSEKDLQNEVVASAELQDNHEMELKQQEIYLDEQLAHSTRTSYELLCASDNELLQSMKSFSLNLHEHANRIGDLSKRAAKEISANEMLAYAGGLYHEIGKLKGKNYIEEGMKIAEEYAFPAELKAILKEHNIKYEKPSSAEAAIVMLSDNIVATLEYIEKNDKNKYIPNKIIENIFQMRMDKGTLDASGLSLMDYKKLKEFYQKEFSS